MPRAAFGLLVFQVLEKMDFLHSRKTKIICTVGPACESPEMMLQMAQSGMNAMRFNFSHEDAAAHRTRITRLNEINESLDRKVAVLLDTQGPEIRTGPVKGGGKVQITEGSEITVTSRFCETTPQRVFVTYERLPEMVSKGMQVLFADGNFELEVLETNGSDEVRCKVTVGGMLGGRKNVGVPGMEVDLPTLTERDVELVKVGAECGADYVAQSFVRSPEDVLELMEILHENGSDAAIIAKIEHGTAVSNIDKIIAASDGAMVARGDLGVQIPLEQVPPVQKSIIRKCNAAGKPVIVATHMLESMIANPRPTRAEATDVANAVYDGADAVMLSGETAVGKYPLKALQTMAAIASEAEKTVDFKGLERSPFPLPYSISSAIDRASCQLAFDLGAIAIITPTSKGFTPRSVSKNRPKAEIIALTPDKRVQRKLSLIWGVQAITFSPLVNSENMMIEAVRAAKEHGLIQPGQTVVVTAGVPLGASGSTNTLRVQVVD